MKLDESFEKRITNNGQFRVEKFKVEEIENVINMAKEALGDKLTGNIVKEIYVPGRIVNIVVK